MHVPASGRRGGLPLSNKGATSLRTVRRHVDSHSIDEFIFATDESAPDFVVTSFADWLQEYIEDGAEFRDGQTLQYGYTLLSCRAHSRTLRLLAPDFRSMPIKWIHDLGAAFHIVAAHKYTPETFGLPPDIPTLRNTAIIGRRFDEIPMFANRLSPVESNRNDSGWFIGSQSDDVDNNDPDQLRVVSLYEAMLAVPHVVNFLSLPVGCQVVFSGGRPVVLKDYEELQIPKDSYLDRVFSAE
jgi:hypothetical protein